MYRLYSLNITLNKQFFFFFKLQTTVTKEEQSKRRFVIRVAPTYIELLEERFIGQFECGEPIGGLEGLVEKAGLVHGWLHVAVIPVVEGSCNMYVAACNVHISLVMYYALE